MEILGNNELLNSCILDVYQNGPCSNKTLTFLSLFKYLGDQSFKEKEKGIILSMGLFYKTFNVDLNNKTFPFKVFKALIENEFQDVLTPVQADIMHLIKENDSVMFSAPTSIGKSHLLREIVLKQTGNIIVVVPTRALLNEYIKDLKNELKKHNDRTTNVLPFIENINLAHSTRNIYVLTPERCMELLKIRPDISLFVIDEAQLIDSRQGIRSVKFRAMINKINSHYRGSKMLFAYPFVRNLDDVKGSNSVFNNSVYKTYNQKTVGQLFVHETERKRYHVQSNFNEDILNNIEDPLKKILISGKRALIFCDKSKIYSGEIYETMQQYISLCNLNLNEDEKRAANEIIKKIEEKIGVTGTIGSQMIDNLKKGIAIHHGSLPHEIRVLIEKFINLGFSQICFATPTLEQGINLPFDLIYIDSFRNIHSPLELKNLIGRAGRASTNSEFDYGIVVFRNKDLFWRYMNSPIEVDSKTDPIVGEDDKPLKDAIMSDSLDENTNMPKETLTKMSEKEVLDAFEYVLNQLFDDEAKVKTTIEKSVEKKIAESFCTIYKAYLHGREVENAERRVFFESIYLMIDKLQKKKFSQIVNERYSFAKKHSWRYFDSFTQLPDKSAGFSNVLNHANNEKCYFDIIVYDTFEYIDKNFNLFLKDIFYAISFLFKDKRENNQKNEAFMNLMKYGSDCQKDIMLFKYGFVEDEIDVVRDCVERIDENEIVFNDNIDTLPEDIKEKCLFYKY